MTVAVVAMAYLPMSTLAVSNAWHMYKSCSQRGLYVSNVEMQRQTIFAMPVIDFTATWRDINNRVVPHGTTSVSIYLVYYIMVVVLLTLGTMELWWYWRNHGAQPKWKRSIIVISIIYVLRFPQRVFRAVGKFLLWLLLQKVGTGMSRAKDWYDKKQGQGMNVIV